MASKKKDKQVEASTEKPVEFISVRDARENLSETLDKSQATIYVITNHGKPVGVLQECEGKTIAEIVREFSE